MFPRYYNYTLSVNGKAERHGDDYARDYLTDVIRSVMSLRKFYHQWMFRRKAVQFLDHVSKSDSQAPFLMVLSPPACHAPFTPAPQYRDKFKEKKAPRTPAFNHGSVRYDQHL